MRVAPVRTLACARVPGLTSDSTGATGPAGGERVSNQTTEVAMSSTQVSQRPGSRFVKQVGVSS
jgi:hypothetical protein